MLIGLAGAAGAGKGSVAAALQSLGGEWAEIGFADPLYAAAEVITGVPQARLRDRSAKERPIDWLGKSPREILQILGTEFGRMAIKESIWVDRAMMTVDGNEAAGVSTVITDVRFDNEAAAIKRRGGFVWEVVRPSHRCLVGQAARHSSEAGVARNLIDKTIVNDGTLDDLLAAVDAAVRTLQKVTMK